MANNSDYDYIQLKEKQFLRRLNSTMAEKISIGSQHNLFINYVHISGKQSLQRLLTTCVLVRVKITEWPDEFRLTTM